MGEEFLNSDGGRKRQQLIEHILRLLGMAERDGPKVPGTAAKKCGGTRDSQLATPCRPISTQSLQPMRVRCDDNGLSFTYGQVTWIGIQVG